MSSAARPATCGDAWLVPISPISRLPAVHAVSTGAPAGVKLAMSVLLQSDQTHDAMSTPHGHADVVNFGASALPPGAATLMAERPKFV